MPCAGLLAVEVHQGVEHFAGDVLQARLQFEDLFAFADLPGEGIAIVASGKGDGPHLCEAPFGPFRQMGTVPFSASGGRGVVGPPADSRGRHELGIGGDCAAARTAEVGQLRKKSILALLGHGMAP